MNQTAIELLASNFSIPEYVATVKPLLVFVIAIVVYSVFVFKFYKLLAKRDFLELELQKHSKGFTAKVQSFMHKLLYLVENIVITPLLVFFWFIVLSSLLLIISKSHTTESLLLTAAALVGAVRITAYYNENLSQDLAKMVPFALLGIFMTDLSFFSFDSVFKVIKNIPLMWKTLVYFLLFIILVETVMRILETIVFMFIKPKKK